MSSVTVVQMSPAATEMTGGTGGEGEWTDGERNQSADKHYNGTSVTNQIQSTELSTLTSPDKLDTTLVALQGIRKVWK